MIKNFSNKNAMIYISQIFEGGKQKFGSVIQAKLDEENIAQPEGGFGFDSNANQNA